MLGIGGGSSGLARSAPSRPYSMPYSLSRGLAASVSRSHLWLGPGIAHDCTVRAQSSQTKQMKKQPTLVSQEQGCLEQRRSSWTGDLGLAASRAERTPKSHRMANRWPAYASCKLQSVPYWSSDASFIEHAKLWHLAETATPPNTS